MSDLIEILFLGTGTSTGVPMIGCDCKVCTSKNFKNDRYRSSILVKCGDLSFIVDTGPEFRLQCIRARIKEDDIDSILFTHAHMDHVAGFDDLRRFTYGEDSSIDIYGRKHTLDFLKKMFFYAFDAENNVKNYVRANPILVEGKFRLGNLDIIPIDVIHGSIPTYGFIFCLGSNKKVAYIPDCKVIPDNSMKLLEGVEILIIDALHHRLHPSHMNFTEALEVVKILTPKKTYFTHITHCIDHDEDEADLMKLIDNVFLAYDGLKFSI